jgi:hypothetical protein
MPGAVFGAEEEVEEPPFSRFSNLCSTNSGSKSEVMSWVTVGKTRWITNSIHKLDKLLEAKDFSSRGL